MFLRSCLFLFILTGLFADPVTISGILQSTSGKPVKKAIITLRNLKNEILLESKSNRKGKFLFEGDQARIQHQVGVQSNEFRVLRRLIQKRTGVCVN